MNEVKRRQAIEKSIARRVVRDALADGYTIAVNNGGNQDEYEGMDFVKVMAAMFQTDDETLYLNKGDEKRSWIKFIYGNDGPDVIHDYTTNLEGILTGAHALASRYEEGDGPAQLTKEQCRKIADCIAAFRAYEAAEEAQPRNLKNIKKHDAEFSRLHAELEDDGILMPESF